MYDIILKKAMKYKNVAYQSHIVIDVQILFNQSGPCIRFMTISLRVVRTSLKKNLLPTCNQQQKTILGINAYDVNCRSCSILILSVTQQVNSSIIATNLNYK